LANKNIFDNVKTIEVMSISKYEDNNTVCCEILITINGIDKIQVIDVITFNEQTKIESIKAYKI